MVYPGASGRLQSGRDLPIITWPITRAGDQGLAPSPLGPAAPRRAIKLQFLAVQLLSTPASQETIDTMARKLCTTKTIHVHTRGRVVGEGGTTAVAVCAAGLAMPRG